MSGSSVIRAGVSDARTAAELASKLYSSPADELEGELRGLLSGDDAAVFLRLENGAPVGFAQCQLRRDYVEGASTSPVGYLEGIFVEEPYRNRGFARELLHSCEEWAAGRGSSEFASDCELCNDMSLRFHLACGFAEANRVICFLKRLRPDERK